MSRSSITPLRAAHQAEQAKRDQQWAAAREWIWSLDAMQAVTIQEGLRLPLKQFVEALGHNVELARAVRKLAAQCWETLLDGCLEETITLNEDPQAANADAVEEGSNVADL